MSNFVKALAVSELPSGSKKSVFVSGKRLMVANVDGQFFAIDDACTHAGCSLGGEGFLDGSIITCGCHGGQFDLATGKVVSPPPQADTHTYETKVEGSDLFVSI